MRLDIAGQDPQFEVAIGVDGHDAGNPRFHVLVADDGMEMDLEAGDAYVIPPGHDAWVVGDETVTGIEFSREAIERFAKG